MQCFKFLLHVFNVIFTLGGITLIAIGIWTAVDKIYLSSIIGNTLFSAASYLLIVVGVITMCVCILGIYATLTEHFRMLIVYFGCLILAVVLMLVAGILAVVFKSEMESAMVNEMRKTLIDGYGKEVDATDAWDQVQKDLKCCAISQDLIDGGSGMYTAPYVDGSMPQSTKEREAQDSWPMYKRTDWFREQNGLQMSDKKYVPRSCCKYESGEYASLEYCQNFASGPPVNYAMALKNNYIYYDGCYGKAKTLVMDHADILVALGFIFAFVMIGGLVLTFLVIRQIKSGDDDDHVKRRREPDNL